MARFVLKLGICRCRLKDGAGSAATATDSSKENLWLPKINRPDASKRASRLQRWRTAPCSKAASRGVKAVRRKAPPAPARRDSRLRAPLSKRVAAAHRYRPRISEGSAADLFR